MRASSKKPAHLAAVLLLLPLLALTTGCDALDELFATEEESAESMELALVGTWQYGVSGCNPSTTISFNSSGNGALEVIDCNGVCPNSRYDFSWEATGTDRGQLTLNYSSASICNQPQDIPPPVTTSWSVSGGQLHPFEETWNRAG